MIVASSIGDALSDHDANRGLAYLAAEMHNARDRAQLLACSAPEMMVRRGDREAMVTPDENWNAVLSWAETSDGFTEEIRQIMIESDLVFLRSRYTGKHRGEWKGLPATGRNVAWDPWQVLRLVDGVIAEERMLMDERSLHQQLTSPE